MNSATEHRTCPSCGAAIPANAPQGICPKCLMAAAALVTEAGQTGGKRPEPPSLERLAAAFPQLEVIEFIGQGGMGAVYKARQKQLDRVVALKVLPPGIGGDPSFAERFTREAKALAKLLHPNIVALFEFGQADGIYYLLMEYVDGVSLGRLLRSSRVSAREALAIVPQICDALQYAHDQGIVHRDIKPENILLDRRGRVKVADFGLAKLVEANTPLTPSGGQWQMADGKAESAPLTDAGKIMGTPNYMAPEQVEHPGEVDHRADIYALGVVFYQMLTGELPGKLIEAPSKRVQIDVRLDEVVLRALEQNPHLRYQHVSEVKTCVETILNSGSAAAPSTGQVGAQGPKCAWIGSLPKLNGPLVLKRGNRRVLNRPVIGINILNGLFLICVLLPIMLKGLSCNASDAKLIELLFIGFLVVFYTVRLVHGFMLPSESPPARPGVAPAPARGRDYRTPQTLLGLPLVHVTWGIDPATGRPRVAKGILAVGPVAYGVIAVGFSVWGLFPCGLVAGGFWATGLFAVGFWVVGLAAVGFQAVGLLAVASWHTVGLVAVGPTPIGLERIVVDKGMVALMFALAIAAVWLIHRLIRAIGSAAAASATIVAKPRQTWWTWWLFQSPGAGRICAHLKKEERKHLLVLLLLYSVWVMVTIFGIPALNGPMRDAGSGDWIVTTVWAGLFIVSLPMIARMMRHFFCSSDWARRQAITPDKLRLFSFGATPVGTMSSTSESSTRRCEEAQTESARREAGGEKHRQSLVASTAARAQRRPWPLMLVAVLFIVPGCIAAWDIGSGLHTQSFRLNLGILGLSVGIGLLRLRSQWRVVALIMIWVPFILGACLGIVALFGQFTIPSHAKFFGYELTGISRLVATIVACTLIPILLVWMSRVLTRSDVKALFQGRGSDRPWIEWAALPIAVLICFVLSSLAGRAGSAQPNTANASPGVSNTAGFGPVIERTLPMSDLGYSWCLDLDADLMTRMPASLTQADWSSGTKLSDGKLSDGIIVIAPEADQPLKVAGTGTRVVPLLDGVHAWETMRPSEISVPEEVVSGQTVTVTGEHHSPPLTFAFKTGRGGFGLMQITGFTENPRGVKLRYKLVLPQSAEASARLANAIHRNTNTGGSALPPQAVIVRVFTPADRPISGEFALTEDNAWAAACTTTQTFRLFEVSNPGVERCRAFYRARLKSERLVGRAYLEMWCQFPSQGEFFSRGLDNSISGSSDWATCQTPFFLKAGERPDLIRLNLVVEGRGKVFIKDIELTAAPLN